MKKRVFTLVLCLCILMLSGCTYNDNMMRADVAKNEAYGKAMAAYYENTKNMVPTKVADIQLSDDGKVKAFVVYNTNVKLPDAPIAPKDTKTAATQTTEAIVNSSVVGSFLQILGTGLIVKIATDSAGDSNSHNSGSNNQSGGDQNISGAGTASLNASTTDASAHSSDSSTTNIHTEEKTGSDNTQQTDTNNDKSDNSQADVNNDKSDNSDNSDNSTDNSDNSQSDTNNNKPVDNSIDNTDQYSGGTSTTYEAAPTP